MTHRRGFLVSDREKYYEYTKHKKPTILLAGKKGSAAIKRKI
jgi:hypothetical protein